MRPAIPSRRCSPRPDRKAVTLQNLRLELLEDRSSSYAGHSASLDQYSARDARSMSDAEAWRYGGHLHDVAGCTENVPFSKPIVTRCKTLEREEEDG